MHVLASELAKAVNVLDPNMRFDPMNHAPMLPRCVTCMVDTFPKEVHAGSVKNGKYGFKVAKGSIVADLRGNILDFQFHEYGNRHDAVFWPYHQAALGWQEWEFGLADMAYELCSNLPMQYVRRRLLHSRTW